MERRSTALRCTPNSEKRTGPKALVCACPNYVAARSGCIHGRHNPFNIVAQSGPLLVADNHERDISAFEILLVAHVLVSRQQNFEPCRFSSRNQFAINQSIPSALKDFNNDMV